MALTSALRSCLITALIIAFALLANGNAPWNGQYGYWNNCRNTAVLYTVPGFLNSLPTLIWAATRFYNPATRVGYSNLTTYLSLDGDIKDRLQNKTGLEAIHFDVLGTPNTTNATIQYGFDQSFTPPDYKDNGSVTVITPINCYTSGCPIVANGDLPGTTRGPGVCGQDCDFWIYSCFDDSIMPMNYSFSYNSPPLQSAVSNGTS